VYSYLYEPVNCLFVAYLILESSENPDQDEYDSMSQAGAQIMGADIVTLAFGVTRGSSSDKRERLRQS
jgi:hypothetical protein